MTAAERIEAHPAAQSLRTVDEVANAVNDANAALEAVVGTYAALAAGLAALVATHPEPFVLEEVHGTFFDNLRKSAADKSPDRLAAFDATADTFTKLIADRADAVRLAMAVAVAARGRRDLQ